MDNERLDDEETMFFDPKDLGLPEIMHGADVDNSRPGSGWQPSEGCVLPPSKRQQSQRFEDGLQVLKIKYGDDVEVIEFESDIRRLFGPVDGGGS